MKYSSFFLAASLGILAACSGFEKDIPVETNDDVEISKVVFNVQPVIDDDAVETRASAVPQSDYNVTFAWEATDKIGIFPNKGSQIYFVPEDGVGTSSASFDGGGWALKPNSTYISYYPFVADFELDRNAVPISFTGQKQNGTEGPFDGERWVLATGSTTSQNGKLTFEYNILNTIINVIATLPAGTYTSASLNIAEPLFVQEGTVSLDDQAIIGTTFSKKLEIELEDFTLASQAEVPIYFMAAPIDLTGKDITVIITKDDGTRYKCVKAPSGPYNAGRRRGLTCAMQKDADIINFADAEVKRICIENWDSDGDGELDMDEAAAVTDLDHKFEHSNISSFDELQYFTGLSKISGDFFGCRNLTSIILPETLTELGEVSFLGCISLTSIYIPASLTIISRWVMTWQTSLTDIFYGCNSLESIIVSPENPVFDSRNNCNAIIETASNTLVFGCKNAFIPDGVECIGYCSLGSASSSRDGTFDDFPSLVAIPNSVVTIEDQAFQSRRTLSSVTFGNSVEIIGRYAFEDCSSLTSVDLPETLTSIGDRAFKSCVSLSSVICRATTPPSGGNGMFDDTNNCPIFVPAGSVATYKSASGWSDYSDRIFSMEGGVVPGPGNDGND